MPAKVAPKPSKPKPSEPKHSESRTSEVVEEVPATTKATKAPKQAPAAPAPARKSTKANSSAPKPKSNGQHVKTVIVEAPEAPARAPRVRKALESPMGKTGVSIAGVRILKVMIGVFNERALHAKRVILQAENPPPPRVPASADAKAVAKAAEASRPIPLSAITDKITRDVLMQAEGLHQENIRRQYEADMLDKLKQADEKNNTNERERYDEALREAKLAHRHTMMASQASAFIAAMSPSTRKQYSELILQEAKAAAYLAGLTPAKLADYKSKLEAARSASEVRSFNLAAFNLEYDPQFYSANVSANSLEPESIEKFNKKFDSQFYSLDVDSPFNLKEFNLRFNPKFYAGLANFPDPYSSSHPRPNNRTSWNEYSRARALITKLCIRVSGDSQHLLACFLDHVVEQLARNGIYNCSGAGVDKDGKQNQTPAIIVKLSHGLQRSDGYERRVPLHRLIASLDEYDAAQYAIHESARLKVQYVLEHKANSNTPKPKYPEYKNFHHPRNFTTYVTNVCKFVRLAMTAEEQNNGGSHDYTKEISISSKFKQFCSDVVYAITVRISKMLAVSLRERDLKTVTMKNMQEAIASMHAMLGIDYTASRDLIKARLAQYLRYCEETKRENAADKRAGKTKTKAKATVDPSDDEDEVESDDEPVDEAEDDIDVEE